MKYSELKEIGDWFQTFDYPALELSLNRFEMLPEYQSYRLQTAVLKKNLDAAQEPLDKLTGLGGNFESVFSDYRRNEIIRPFLNFKSLVSDIPMWVNDHNQIRQKLTYLNNSISYEEGRSQNSSNANIVNHLKMNEHYLVGPAKGEIINK